MPLVAGAVGLGLRPEMYRELEERAIGVDYLEIIAENFLDEGSMARARLRRVSAGYPVVVHGVGLNLLGSDPLDMEHLARLRGLAQELASPFVTDHLCWANHAGVRHHDLLPSPYTHELVDYAADRAARAQDFLGVPFGVENLSSYVAFAGSTMPEHEFYVAVAESADVGLLLDVNNVFVSAENHGFSAAEYLAAVPVERVLEIHLAGHQRLPSGLLHDTHDRPVCDEVWRLYRETWQRRPSLPTLIEWDANLPQLAELERHVSLAHQVRAS
jgi:uncharacterized protein